jgi:hypothetical protein
MENPSVIYIVAIFTTFIYDCYVVNDYKMTAR